ncbi:hypothetical protein EC991_003484 [Linnemannia zychae]|nr:hypothetical protein EC991_003484 [Linnemannia zychae]
MAVNREDVGVTYFAEGNVVTIYNPVTNAWSESIPICQTPIPSNESVKSLLQAVVDPKSGFIYIPKGYNMGTEMLVFNNLNNVCTAVAQPAPNLDVHYKAVWSEVKNTMYILGEEDLSLAGLKLWEFLPTSLLGGQKLLLFGGSAGTLGNGNMYIFDTATNVWTTGAPSPVPRTEMACATAGDFFIAWGGSDVTGGGSTTSTEILFYNIKTNKWLKQADIVPPSTALPTTASSASSVSPSNSSAASPGSGNASSNSGSSKITASAIGGGIAGFVVVVAIVGFIFFRHRKQAKPIDEPKEGASDTPPLPEDTSIVLSPTSRPPQLMSYSAAGSASPFQLSATARANPSRFTSQGVTQYHGTKAELGAHPHTLTPSDPQLYGSSPQQHQYQEQGHQELQLNNPQYIASSYSQGSSPYQQSMQHSPSFSPSTQNPQSLGQDVLNHPQQQLALIQAKHEQALERIRIEQEVELERMKRQWQEDQALAQFSSLDNQVLYIRGGLSEGQVVSQFYSLDLSPFINNPSPSTNPVWKKLNSTGPLGDFDIELPLAVQFGNQDVAFFGSNRTRSLYHSSNNTWSASVPTCKIPDENVYVFVPSSRGGRVAVTDPNSNYVYLPHATKDGVNMVALSINLGYCYFLPMPTGAVGNNFVWSQYKGTIYMLGTQMFPTATNPTGKDPMLWDLNQDTNIWRHIPDPNTPALFLGSCVVSVLGGRKLIIFGGTSASGQANGYTYIYDTIVSTWTTGMSSVKPRTNMACASAGDYLIAWGGHEHEKSTSASSEMLIYNFKTDTWINQIKIVPTPPPPPVTSNSDALYKNNAPVIRGSASAGAVFIVAVIIGFIVLRRHRRQRAAARRHPQDSKLDLAPSTPPKQLTPVFNPRNTIRHQNTAQGQTDINDPENHFGLGFNPLNGNQDPQELPPSPTLYAASISTRTLVPYPVPPKWLSQTQLKTKTSTTLYASPQIYSQELEKLPWEQPICSPQYIESHSPILPPVRQARSPDYTKIEQEFPSPPVVRDPHELEPDNAANSLDKIMLTQERLEQDVDRLQKEEQEELKKTRKQWEQQMSGRP